ncbi:hypothetical protein I3843_01G144400 [Carya illinoinensis]|nr:hypothetical protein I3843_01G144400 [Carya illinoinensis]
MHGKAARHGTSRISTRPSSIYTKLQNNKILGLAVRSPLETIVYGFDGLKVDEEA